MTIPGQLMRVCPKCKEGVPEEEYEEHVVVCGELLMPRVWKAKEELMKTFPTEEQEMNYDSRETNRNTK